MTSLSKNGRQRGPGRPVGPSAIPEGPYETHDRDEAVRKSTISLISSSICRTRRSGFSASLVRSGRCGLSPISFATIWLGGW